MGDVALVAPFVLDALDVHRSGSWDGFDTDAAVLLEAVVLNLGVDQLVKVATHRPRPLLYGLSPGDARLSDAVNYRSFYSGHTSGTFAVGMAYARTHALRHPGSRGNWAVYGGVIVVGATVGALRVAAGEHFPTDVLVGAAAGTAIGLLVPALHRPQALRRVALVPARGGVMLRIQLPPR